MKINPNDPARPWPESLNGGLTIRAEFAKAAMQGLLASGFLTRNLQKEIKRIAVEIADDLIEELNGEEKT